MRSVINAMNHTGRYWNQMIFSTTYRTAIPSYRRLFWDDDELTYNNGCNYSHQRSNRIPEERMTIFFFSKLIKLMRTTKFIGRKHSSQSSDRCQDGRIEEKTARKNTNLTKERWKKRHTHTHAAVFPMCDTEEKKLGGQAAHCVYDRSEEVVFFIPHGGAVVHTRFFVLLFGEFFPRHPRSVRISTKGPGIVSFFFYRQTVQCSDCLHEIYKKVCTANKSLSVRSYQVLRFIMNLLVWVKIILWESCVHHKNCEWRMFNLKNQNKSSFFRGRTSESGNGQCDKRMAPSNRQSRENWEFDHFYNAHFEIRTALLEVNGSNFSCLRWNNWNESLWRLWM